MLWLLAWTAVFAANLVIPMTFANLIFSERKVNGEGQDLGMALAIAIVWLLGGMIGLKSSDRRFKLISGGGAVAASQAFPMLQVILGLASLVFVSWALDDPKSGFGGFLATLLSGSFLLLASYLAGVLIHRTRGAWRAAKMRFLSGGGNTP
ncbi:hypothetical protein [Singulisphaera sp. GP187]|uniref:hypothetical protein n=1 Tax=Singulisphaera sp. GP187 TaxID=1882752 RepID=UPI000940F545|nr:hypothetical protein [Singulisphaera sp. GP187]